MKNFLIAILAISMVTGCTTTRTYQSVSADTANRVEPGETAVIEYTDGSTEKVEIRQYGATSLDLVGEDNTLRSVAYADIRAVHDKEFSGGKTAALGAGTLLLLTVVGLSTMYFPVGM